MRRFIKAHMFFMYAQVFHSHMSLTLRLAIEDELMEAYHQLNK